MNIQNFRFVRVFSLFLALCIMFAILAVPAFAATYAVEVVTGTCPAGPVVVSLFEYLNLDLQGYDSYSALTDACGLGTGTFYPIPCSIDGIYVYLKFTICKNELQTYNDTFGTNYEFPVDPYEYYTGPDGIEYLKFKAENITVLNTRTIEFTCHISDVVTVSAFGFLTSDMVYRVMDEIKTILPHVVPVLVSIIGLRKALDFLQWIMNRA